MIARSEPVTVSPKRTLKIEKLARIYDAEILPVWGNRFGKMLLRNLSVPEKGQVLDISCGTGYPTNEILRRMSEGSRIIAIDASSAMLDVARRKIADLGPLGKKGVFFRTESPVPKLSFADDVYDLVVCNLGLSEMPSIEVALRDFARVTKVHGEVRCTLPLAGTFQEFHDLYREVLIKHDKPEALDRLDRHIARYPTIDHVERCMKSANLEGEIEAEEFTLLFKSSREFFFAPVIEYGPLTEWKEIAGAGQEMQDVFWYIKEAIDAYFDGRPFQVTVKAGCLIGRKSDGEPLDPDEIELDLDGPSVEELVEPVTDLPRRPLKMAAGSVRVDEISEEDVIDEESPDEQELDAFIDGKSRPQHLGGDGDEGESLDHELDDLEDGEI
jgi:ubiquinone/menaquinone biosynthesis C-methylase UbiE